MMAMSPAQTVWCFVLAICTSLLSGHFVHAMPSFFYNFSDPTTFSHDDLYFEGDAYAGDGSVILAREQLTGDSAPRIGRVSYRLPVHLWNNATDNIPKELNRPLVVGAIAFSVLLGVAILVVSLLRCLSRCISRPSHSLSVTSSAEIPTVITSAQPSFGFAAEFPTSAARPSLAGVGWRPSFAGNLTDYLLGDSSNYPRIFSYEELSDGTDNFSEERLLGDSEGAGSFYKGDLIDLGVVAIKKVKQEPGQIGLTKLGIHRVANIRHRNLVQLLGLCHEGDNFCVVYEFVHNGNLHDHLYNPGVLLTWPMRYKVVLGIGSALQYLQVKFAYLFFFLNLKTSNVMLDESFDAKISDFLLRWPHFSFISIVTLKVQNMAASRGYTDHERTCMANPLSIVYSFGVVLLEIACGRPPIIRQQDEAAPSTSTLFDSVWDLYEKGIILDAVDWRLNGEFDMMQVERVLMVALWCGHPDYRQRPNIDEAVDSLEFLIPVPRLNRKMPQCTEEHCTTPGNIDMFHPEPCLQNQACSSFPQGR